MNDKIRDVMIELAVMTDNVREHYLTPWSRGEYSYATDGRMMMRAQRLNEFQDRATNDGASTTADSLAMAPTGPTWYDVPADLPPAPGPCPRCHGAGDVKCEACRGDGEVDWEFRHDGRVYDMKASCPICDGDGRVECNPCAGRGRADEPGIEVGPALINPRYLRLLAGLPGCRLAPVDGWAPVAFEFDGGRGRGAVMPVRR